MKQDLKVSTKQSNYPCAIGFHDFRWIKFSVFVQEFIQLIRIFYVASVLYWYYFLLLFALFDIRTSVISLNLNLN